MAQRGSWASYVIWGSVAVCAVLAASVIIALVVGAHRGIQFAGPAKRPAAPTERAQAPTAPQPEAKAAILLPVVSPSPGPATHDLARVNDALSALAAERDRLAERLERIERAVGDITASIRDRSVPIEPRAESNIAAERVVAAPAAVPIAAPASTDPRSTSPRAGAIKPAGPVTDPTEIFRLYSAAQPLVTPPAPTQAPMQIQAAPLQDAPRTAESTTMRTEFAVDLGSEPNMDGLRALWANLRGNHGAALANLRPLVTVREGGRPGSVELRLIAGPLANAGAAARTCAALQTKGVTCQTTVFDGQRLALR